VKLPPREHDGARGPPSRRQSEQGAPAAHAERLAEGAVWGTIPTFACPRARARAKVSSY